MDSRNYGYSSRVGHRRPLCDRYGASSSPEESTSGSVTRAATARRYSPQRTSPAEQSRKFADYRIGARRSSHLQQPAISHSESMRTMERLQGLRAQYSSNHELTAKISDAIQSIFDDISKGCVSQRTQSLVDIIESRVLEHSQNRSSDRTRSPAHLEREFERLVDFDTDTSHNSSLGRASQQPGSSSRLHNREGIQHGSRLPEASRPQTARDFNQAFECLLDESYPERSDESSQSRSELTTSYEQELDRPLNGIDIPTNDSNHSRGTDTRRQTVSSTHPRREQAQQVPTQAETTSNTGREFNRAYERLLAESYPEHSDNSSHNRSELVTDFERQFDALLEDFDTGSTSSGYNTSSIETTTRRNDHGHEEASDPDYVRKLKRVLGNLGLTKSDSDEVCHTLSESDIDKSDYIALSSFLPKVNDLPGAKVVMMDSFKMMKSDASLTKAILTIIKDSEPRCIDNNAEVISRIQARSLLNSLYALDLRGDELWSSLIPNLKKLHHEEIFDHLFNTFSYTDLQESGSTVKTEIHLKKLVNNGESTEIRGRYKHILEKEVDFASKMPPQKYALLGLRGRDGDVLKDFKEKFTAERKSKQAFVAYVKNMVQHDEKMQELLLSRDPSLEERKREIEEESYSLTEALDDVINDLSEQDYIDGMNNVKLHRERLIAELIDEKIDQKIDKLWESALLNTARNPVPAPAPAYTFRRPPFYGRR